MKTKIQFLILLLFSINSYAHKDKFFHENYGNVKVYMRTGFNYSDLDKIKIIGKLSEKLSKNLNYKDTIFIEYIQDYTNLYKDDLYLLEYNNSNFKLINGLEEPNSLETNNNGLSVRIYADQIKILDVLKFVEYLVIIENILFSFIIRFTLFKFTSNHIFLNLTFTFFAPYLFLLSCHINLI